MLIKLRDISKIYKMDGVEIKALDKVSLEIKDGEFAAIIGPSGSGKSTLMHVIGFLDALSSGSYFFEDVDVSGFSDSELAKIRNRKVGFIFQSFNLLPKTSSLDNVKLPALYSKNKNDTEERAKKLLERVGLKDRMQNKPSQLSGGQQQRVAIARSLMNDPQIILADEPTGNLDSKSGDEVLKILTQLNKEGKTVVIVTHDQNVANTAKRNIFISDGKIVKDTLTKN
ncbi:macrolide ABC transporter ATP-binding protein [candidate division WWE3 bacterium RIFCSPHIGHO2_01_FULL_40_23]|uniref:Macrolide ABC transporter ATP-binding protein n=1 Tax=candidate division WWE3 bacterium RIFCSPLOWO2_01_FULL_41_18 TaxID=1802625 RepID=A0A1F4VFT1_UNCKA|nr:MAG: macrolide ABC transporter ATP-binding protein [candidate division WWE3 bacterium RIFCSPHIGHO2_01_FULL_40_23]OGC55935.1 MAG: macrolide ABC transporter ATP-binding protein [candidate division WWE3 bacterium RIFCSPLOWO2_01_FULL_41_18]